MTISAAQDIRRGGAPRRWERGRLARMQVERPRSRLGADAVCQRSVEHPPRRAAAARGWSLMELTVVLVIIGLLASLVGPRVLGYLERGQVDAANIQMKHIKSGLLTYRMDVGELPSTEQGLEALVKAPPGLAEYWRGPYLDDAVPLDPWRTPYRYERRAEAARGYVLYSYGADKKAGGEGNNADFGLLPERA